MNCIVAAYGYVERCPTPDVCTKVCELFRQAMAAKILESKQSCADAEESQRNKRAIEPQRLRRWDKHFLQLALDHARMSKDPSTRVGAIIVGPDREILSMGFNGLPRGIEDSGERLENRDEKLRLIVHAEMNAALAAARNGVRIKGARMFIAACSAGGITWGGPPCTRCCVELIQCGIIEVVSYPMKTAPSRWHDDLKQSLALLTEAGINYREVS